MVIELCIMQFWSEIILVISNRTILNREYKKLPSAKNILGDLATFNFSIVLLAAQVIAKSKVTSNSAGAVIKLSRMFSRETKDTSVSK